MFSSPAPRATPRKSIYRRAGDPGSASRAGSSVLGTPSLYSERERGREREPATPSARGASSRIATLREASPVSTSGVTAGGETVRTARYDAVGEWSDKVYWSRDERMAVSALGGLPREVQDVVKRSDLINNRVSGHVDLASGYAFLSTPSTCAVWNYAKRSQASPTVYPFPAPSSPLGPTGPPTSASLHTVGSAEPGLILVSPSGEIRFWDSLGSALSNVDRYQQVQLDLGDDEYADRIWALGHSSYLITTTRSQAFRLNITSQAGRQVPSTSLLTRSTGMFSRSSPILFNLSEDREGLVSVVVDGSSVWLLAVKTAQKWSLTPDGQKFLLDQDIQDLIGNEVFAEQWSTGSVDLTVCDMTLIESGRYAALISFTEQSSTTSASSSPTYALVLLNTAPRTGSLVVERSIAVGYRPNPDPRQLDLARVYIQSNTACIRFADVIVTIGIDPSSPFEDIIALKDPSRNAFIGVGSAPLHGVKRADNESSLVLMSATGGLMGVTMYTAPINVARKTDEVLATERLKSKLEQAVFYGDRNDNPLSFDLFGDSESDVAKATGEVSSEIISATSPYMPAIYEIRPLLNDRLSRLKQLIEYVRRNGLLPKLSQVARRNLSRDAEKAKGAIELWDYQNRLMDQAHSSSPASLLADSIAHLMQQHRATDSEDIIRQFFRTHIQHMEQLLAIVFQAYQAASDGADVAEQTAWTVEVNKIFEIIVRAASQYREDELATYEMDRQNPSIELWTASTPILDALEVLYNTTVRLLTERTRDFGTAIDQAAGPNDVSGLREQRSTQNAMKNHLTKLAAALCTNMEDKLRATSRRHMVEGGDEQEGVALKRRWDALRPAVIRPLVQFDRLSYAYQLAEHHGDFETLVWLCHAPQLAKDTSSGTARLQRYIEQFGQDFAFVLYQWYIDQGQQHALLSQDEVYSGLVTKFFAQRNYPELSWLHDIACGRFGSAGAALAVVQGDSRGLNQKNLMGSIGKLALVADEKGRGSTAELRSGLASFDDSLESVALQQRLRQSIVDAVGKRSTQDPVPVYMKRHVTLLDDRPALKTQFETFARQLSNGEALDVEGLIDVLTLKDNKGEEDVDAAWALDKLAKTSNLATGRRQVALQSIWRRVFIRDDWAHINNTSGRSEDAQRRLLKGTGAFAMLRAVEQLTDLPRSYVLTPVGARSAPTPGEISARFPGYSPDEVNQLLADHEQEIEVLLRYLDDDMLDERVREVAELVKEESRCAGRASVLGNVHL